MKIKCPCTQDCEDRSPNCHSICPDYLEYEKAKHKEYADKKARYKGEEDYNTHKEKVFKRIKRGRRKGL